MTSSTPAPRQRTTQMNLAEIMGQYNIDIHGPKEKRTRSYIPPKERRRRSYIPSQKQARDEDERRFGGKEANDERIARNREKDEKRWQALELARMEEELEKAKWEWASAIRSPSPRRSSNRQGPTEIFYRDGQREMSPRERFGGPRREHKQRPGTSTGSCPSASLSCLPSSSTTIRRRRRRSEREFERKKR